MALIFNRKKPEPKVLSYDALDVHSAYTLKYLKKVFSGRIGYDVWMKGQRIADIQARALFYKAVVEDHRKGSTEALENFNKYKYTPVGIEEFINSKLYLNKKDEVYPAVMDELIEMNSGKYVELVLTGGIGSAKTTCALYTNLYQLYLLSCLRSPHQLYGMDSSSEILLIFQSVNKELAKLVEFARFKSMVDGSQYFREAFPYNKMVASKLIFPNRIEVVPVSGSETATLGQNVIGGLIDELNYMVVIEKSKQAADKGTYDQAITLYNSIARRRKSRFLEQGKLPGILCLVSSKKYPGQFTDQKEEEAKSDPTIYIYDKRVWEIKPKGTFTKGFFNIFVGDTTRKPRILDSQDEADVHDKDRHMVMQVPVDFKEDFKKDIINALREIAGVSTLARHPYFLETDKVAKAFGHYHSIFQQTVVDFLEVKLGIQKGAFYKPDLPRFVHVDLAISGDSAGLAVGTVEEFVPQKREIELETEIANILRNMQDMDESFMPKFHIDGVLEIRPPKNSEILFWKIREVIMVLRKMGLNIRWVTYDGFESTDSMQILRQQGFVTGYQSIDIVPTTGAVTTKRRPQPYDFLKSAVYDGRVPMPSHPHLQKEILMLERDLKTGKIDHPPNGSKDCADALAGIVYGLTMRREVWSLFGIPVTRIPSNITAMPDRMEAVNEKLREDQENYQDMSELEKVQRRVGMPNGANRIN